MKITLKKLYANLSHIDDYFPLEPNHSLIVETVTDDVEINLEVSIKDNNGNTKRCATIRENEVEGGHTITMYDYDK